MEDNGLPRMTRTTRPRYFYGWNIVAASFLAGLSYSEHFSSILGLFIRPLQNEFGWSRSAIAGVQSVGRVIEALFAPIIGPLIDRYGPRVLMPAGAFIVGLAMLGMTQISTIWQFYLLRGVIVGAGFTLMGNLVTDVTINNWFVLKRGRAIAFSRAGVNVGNIVMAPLSVFVIAASGWRTMFFFFAVVTWLFVLIPSAVLMRRRPEDIGQHPDGIDRSIAETVDGQGDASNDETAPALEPVWSRREVMMTKTFWLLAFSFAINSLAFQGINISLIPYIQDMGYADTMLAAVITFRAVAMVVAVSFIGFLAEHSNRTAIRVVPFLIQALGTFFFIMGREPLFLWLGVALYGLGISSIHVTQEVVWANYFGRLSLGLVRSLGYFISFGFGAAGPVAMNAVFDIFGSYQPAFLVIIGLFCGAALLMGIALPAKASRYATASDIIDPKRQ
ncbi:MAG: MFS transporter [Deltaproteobacteria bacterium]|nr:MFS transporter [Deltaproteobacteria bacterium]